MSEREGSQRERGATRAGAAGGTTAGPGEERELSAGDSQRDGAAPGAGRRAELDAVIRSTLDERGLEYERTDEGSYLVRLPGTHKLATMCWLVAGDHALLVEAFVMRHPDENRERLYDFLLQRNARMYGVAFSVDPSGDVYLVGRVALSSVTPDEIDRLLGAVLSYADDNFDAMLEIGFAGSIRREWKWRAARGESLANLQAFARFADPDRQGQV